VKIADLSAGLTQLTESFDSLTAAWAETATRWDDSTSRRLHKEHVEPLDLITRRALSAVHRLAEVLASAERECSDT
jgi:hypothetical protein